MCQTFGLCVGCQDSLDIFGLVAFSVLQCRDLLVYVYCLFDLTDMFATMSPSGRRLSLGSQLSSRMSKRLQPRKTIFNFLLTFMQKASSFKIEKLNSRWKSR